MKINENLELILPSESLKKGYNIFIHKKKFSIESDQARIHIQFKVIFI